MTLPKNRSTSVRKIHKRTAKGNTIHYKRRIKGNNHFCELSGAKLQAVSSKAGVPKSARRPNRKFGGSLSSKYASRILILASRVKEGVIPISEVEVRLIPYVNRLLAKK